MRVLLAVVVLGGCGSKAPATSTPAPDPEVSHPEQSAASTHAAMQLFEDKGYTLSGAEYWPYVGEVDIDYPKEVLWGFYPQAGVAPPGEEEPNPATASPEAVECAEASYRALRAFIESDPPMLREINKRGIDAGFNPKFYLWTNDYTKAATPYPPGVREARLWYWKRKTPDPTRPPGYWKWEATLTQAGECQVPKQPQIDEYLTTTLAELQ